MSKSAPAAFPESAMSFLGMLSRNNNKEWFEKNRDKYEAEFLQPAQAFVEELGADLQNIRPGIQAIPKIDKSIFRLHRDVRFAKDKAPYKTNLGMLFWEGSRKKMENSGMYVHVEKGKLAAALGMYQFAKDQLTVYRDAVADPAKRKKLVAAVKAVEKKGYAVQGRNYKKIPKGYDGEIDNADFLLHDGLYAWFETKDTSRIDAKNFKKQCVKMFKDMLPLHEWLLEAMEQGAKKKR